MSGHSFLVVEDSPTMRQLIAFGLKRIKGATIHEAGNGVEALKKLSEVHIDLILADINMPLMDGLKLLNIVRSEEKYKHIPYVIISTEGAETDKDKGISLGANAYLPKPIKTNELLKIVQDLLKIEK